MHGLLLPHHGPNGALGAHRICITGQRKHASERRWANHARSTTRATALALRRLLTHTRSHTPADQGAPCDVVAVHFHRLPLRQLVGEAASKESTESFSRGETRHYTLQCHACAGVREGATTRTRRGATLSLGRQTTVIKWIKVCDGVSIIMIAQWGAERVQSWPVVFMCCSISICDGIYIQPKFNHMPRNVGNV